MTKEAIDRPLTIVIGAPFEPELAKRIEEAMPGRLRVLHEPDLLPLPRYVADHHGIPRELTPAQRRATSRPTSPSPTSIRREPAISRLV